MARNKGKDPNKLGFGRLMAFKSSDIVSAWINLIMLNYLSIYASDTLGVNLLTVSTLLLARRWMRSPIWLRASLWTTPTPSSAKVVPMSCPLSA